MLSFLHTALPLLLLRSNGFAAQGLRRGAGSILKILLSGLNFVVLVELLVSVDSVLVTLLVRVFEIKVEV